MGSLQGLHPHYAAQSNSPQLNPFSPPASLGNNPRDLAIRRLTGLTANNFSHNASAMGLNDNSAHAQEGAGPYNSGTDDMLGFPSCFGVSGIFGLSAGAAQHDVMSAYAAAPGLPSSSQPFDLSTFAALYGGGVGSFPGAASQLNVPGAMSLADLTLNIPKLPSLNGSLGMFNYAVGGASLGDFPALDIPTLGGGGASVLGLPRQPLGPNLTQSNPASHTNTINSNSFQAENILKALKPELDQTSVQPQKIKEEESPAVETIGLAAGRAKRPVRPKQTTDDDSSFDYDGSSDDYSEQPERKRRLSKKSHSGGVKVEQEGDDQAAPRATSSAPAVTSGGVSKRKTAGSGSPSKPPNKKERRAQNKRDLNREAQRRFRCRQRATFEELEKRGSELQHELTVLRVQNRMLEEQYKALSDSYAALHLKVMQAQVRCGIVL